MNLNLIKMGSLTIIVLAVLMSLTTVPVVVAQATDGGSDDATTIRAKAVALQYMLNNSLRLNLNLSEQLRAQIELLLNANISELTPQELWDFVRNANVVLAEVRERARNAVGRDLETYVRGLAIAIEARVRNMAKHYNVSEDELREMVANITQSRNMREMFEALKRVQERLMERQYQRFANALAEQLRNRVAETFAKGDALGLEVAYRALDKAQEALIRTLERLKATNASSTAIEAIEKALEHISMAKEIIGDLKETLPKPEPEVVRKHLNNTLEKLITRAETEAYELLSKIEELLKMAEKLNATELKEELVRLKEELNSIITKLENAKDIRDVSQVLDDLAALRYIVTRIEGMLSGIIEKILQRLESWLLRIEEQSKKLINVVEELRNKSRNVMGRMPEKVRGIIEKLLDNVTFSLSSTMTSKIEEARSKLKAGDFERILRISTEIEDLLATILKDIEKVKESLEI